MATVARLKTRLFIGRRTREADLVGRLAIERVVGPVFVVPSDDQRTFSLELSLVLGHSGLSQDSLEGPVESLDYRDADVFVDCSEARQDVHGLASEFLKVLTLELGALVDNDMLVAA